MTKSVFLFPLLYLCLLLAHPTATTPDAKMPPRRETFRIEGAVEKAGDWTTDRVTQEFAADLKTVSYTLKGEPGEAQCVPLLAFVQAAKPRLNAKIKNHQLAFVVLVQGSDGYTAAFSLGELLPAYGKREVWIALNNNGKPFEDKDAPAQLLAPEDEKPSRWVHGLARIVVVDGIGAAGRRRK